MSEKTKKLSEGVPVVDANNTVTSTPIDDFSRMVGAPLGIQTANYNVLGPEWIRIAEVDSNGGLLLITNTYMNKISRGVVIAFSGAYEPNYTNITHLTGQIDIFDKVRFVGKSGIVYLEVQSTASTSGNPWFIKMITTDKKENNKLPELYKVKTPGEIPTGFYVKEFSLSQMIWNKRQVDLPSTTTFTSLVGFTGDTSMGRITPENLATVLFPWLNSAKPVNSLDEANTTGIYRVQAACTEKLSDGSPVQYALIWVYGTLNSDLFKVIFSYLGTVAYQFYNSTNKTTRTVILGKMADATVS